MGVPTHQFRRHPDPDILPEPVRAFRTAALRQFGQRLTHIVLYGSRARGDHRRDSDWDIAVFADDVSDSFVEFMPLAEVAGWALADHDIEINGGLFATHALTQPLSSFFETVRREGLEL